MRKRDTDSTIRILLLGAAGVGKDCLESRFTTSTYPPPYDPTLMLRGRRCISVSDTTQQAIIGANTQPLEASYGLMTLPLLSCELERIPSHSSLASNPTFHVEDRDRNADVSAAITSSISAPQQPPSHQGNSTYLVELINYPSLQCPTERAKVLLRGDFDAILLIYDVTSRSSFEIVANLHNEIPLKARDGWSSIKHRRRQLFKSFRPRPRGRDIIVGLVGNKSDVDENNGVVHGVYDILDKEAVNLDVVASEREFMHPLFRRSGLLDKVPPWSPVSVDRLDTAAYGHQHDLLGARRSFASADAVIDKHLRIQEHQQPAQIIRGNPERAVPRFSQSSFRSEKVLSWLELGSPKRETGTPAEDLEQELGHGKWREISRLESCNTTTTTAAAVGAQRQVSRLEGELVAQTLLLQIPFFETSAKTGENVDKVFEAVVNEVIQEAQWGKREGNNDIVKEVKEYRRRCGLSRLLHSSRKSI
ncbi:hypothetical protein F5Y19DRAFT_486280 [Xylariaceae sp. FL1651]|nr:hypothetical protein F5Y19DRAFT_486280 [Xylariaceae sp. FL1651]